MIMEQRTLFVETLSSAIFFLLVLFYAFTLTDPELLILLSISFFIAISVMISHKLQYFKSASVMTFITMIMVLIGLFTAVNFIFSAFILGVATFAFLDFMFSALYIVFKDN